MVTLLSSHGITPQNLAYDAQSMGNVSGGCVYSSVLNLPRVFLSMEGTKHHTVLDCFSSLLVVRGFEWECHSNQTGKDCLAECAVSVGWLDAEEELFT